MMEQVDLVKFDHLKSRIAGMIAPLRGIQVRDKAENAAASGALTTVKGLAKEIESLRTAAVGPLRDQVNAINARAKELQAPLDAAETEIKNVMRSFADAETRRIQEERRLADEEAAAKKRKIDEDAARARKEEEERKRAESAFGVSADAERLRKEEEERARREDQARRDREAADRQARTRAKALEQERPKNTRTVWRFEITERLEVPMEFWDINESRLGQAVRGGAREIPGLRIWSEQEVVARA